MLTRVYKGERVEISAEEEAEIRAEWEQDDIDRANQALADAKQNKIKALRDQKLDELLAPQINAINKAQNQTAIDAVTL